MSRGPLDQCKAETAMNDEGAAATAQASMQADNTVRVIVDVAGSLRSMRFAAASDLTMPVLRALISRQHSLKPDDVYDAVLKYRNDFEDWITFSSEAELEEALLVSVRRGNETIVRVSVSIPMDNRSAECKEMSGRMVTSRLVEGISDVPTKSLNEDSSSSERVQKPFHSVPTGAPKSSNISLELERILRNCFELDRRPISGGSRRSVNCGNGSKRLRLLEYNEKLPYQLQKTQIDKLGQCFKFVNREEQCIELLRLIARLETMRGHHEFDVVKRDIVLPSCLGMPGTGKTRFSRVAVWTLLESVLHDDSSPSGLPKSEDDDINRAIPTLVRKVWQSPSTPPEDRVTSDMDFKTKEDIVRSLISAHREHRNIRLVLSDVFPQTKAGSMQNDGDTISTNFEEEKLAQLVLFEWAKYMPELSYDTEQQRQSPKQREFRRKLSKLSRRHALTVHDAVEFILTTTMFRRDVPRDGKEVPSIMINIDEGQQCSGLLSLVLTIFSKLLVTQNMRVFVTITGATTELLKRDLLATAFQTQNIVLPLLEEHHMAEILLDVLDVKSSGRPTLQISNAVYFGLKWLGGVPRFLEYFLEASARFFLDRECREKFERDWISTPLPANEVQRIKASLWKSLCYNVTFLDIECIILKCASRVVGSRVGTWEETVPCGVISNLFSLAIGEVPTAPETVIHRYHDRWTIFHAQGKQIAYHKTTAKGTGIVKLPPLMLHVYHRSFRTDEPCNQNIPSISLPSVSLATVDSEQLALQVMLHRCYAFSLLNRTTITLRELLGFTIAGPSDGHLHDGPDSDGPGASKLNAELILPKCFCIEKMESRAGESGFVERVQKILKHSHGGKQKSQAIAFVNGKGAHFADAFMVLETASGNAEPFVIYIQDKQSTVSRRNHLAGKCQSLSTAHLKRSVSAEYAKVNSLDNQSCPLRHAFLFITDSCCRAGHSVLANGEPANMPHGGHHEIPLNVILVGRDRHRQFFGDTLAFVRSFAVGAASGDLLSPECNALARSPRQLACLS